MLIHRVRKFIILYNVKCTQSSKYCLIEKIRISVIFYFISVVLAIVKLMVTDGTENYRCALYPSGCYLSIGVLKITSTLICHFVFPFQIEEGKK